MKSAEFSELTGKTLTAVVGLCKGSEHVTFTCDDGSAYSLKYYSDCCACCSVEDVVGNVDDLIGSPLTMADLSESANVNTAGETVPEYQESFTWAYYKLATVKGYVDIRWYGASNGYYSETATFERVS